MIVLNLRNTNLRSYLSQLSQIELFQSLSSQELSWLCIILGEVTPPWVGEEGMHSNGRFNLRRFPDWFVEVETAKADSRNEEQDCP